jgi:outer membrane lipoprotein LolB
MDFGFRITVTVLITILTACTTLSTEPTAPKPSISDVEREQFWEQQKRANSSVTEWSLKGKIGVRTGKKGGTATLKWDYNGADQEIELYGPFGGGRVKISVTENSAVLKDTKGAVIEGNTPNQVLYQRLGWQVPFTELVFWSRGLPSENATDIEVDDSGLLKRMQQGPWQVEYQEYRTDNNLELPRKLIITALPGAMEIYDDEGNYIGDELSVKVIIKRWWNLNIN